MATKAARSRRAEPAPPPLPAARASGWAGALALLALVLVAYAPALDAGFVWDDDDYVTANTTLRSVDGLARIWAEPGAVPQYYPLAFTSLWLDYRLWGLRPFGYHLVNVLLHGVNAVLLWRLLGVLAVPGAWLGAAVFAVHPVHVESVAWVTERKNVLSGALYLAAFLAYLRFAPPGGGSVRPPAVRAYAAALGLFVLAMLSKTVTCTLPAALLLVLWWKRPRLAARDVLPLLPFFGVGLGLAAVTIWMEKHHVGARGVDWALSAVDRGLIAGRALWFYLGKLVWPAPLVFNYPRWRIDAGVWWQYVFPLGAAAAGTALFAARRRIGTAPLVAALFFAVTLLPALGFVDVFPMRYSFVADHFQYLASIGPIALAAALGTVATRGPDARDVRRLGGGAVVLVLAALTWRQAHAYRDLRTLWTDTLAKNPGSWMAHNNLGLMLAGEGRLDDAIDHYRAALRIRADDAFARNNLGYALAMQGHLDAAVPELVEAVRIEPANAEARSNLGNVLMATGRVEEAIAQYREALRG